MSIRKLASGVALAALITSPALAADIDRSYKDVPADYAQSSGMVNWSGFYIGGAIGYGNANHDLTVRDYFKDYCGDVGDDLKDFVGKIDDGDRDDRIDDLDEAGALACATEGNDSVLVAGDSREIASLDGLSSTGLVGDVRLGYDHARGRYLVGVFGSYGFNNMETEFSLADGIIGPDGFSETIEKGEEWSIGARAGYLVAPRTLAYIMAAYTQTEYTFGGLGKDGGDKDVTFDGVTVGGGLEFALAGNIFLGLEATHTFYGGETIFDSYDPATNVGTSVEDDLSETKVMGTLKIKLNNGLFD